jgi:hypothetical protein
MCAGLWLRLAAALIVVICTGAASARAQQGPAPSAAGPMRFAWASSGGTRGDSFIAAEGRIVDSTPRDFQAFLAAADTRAGYTIRNTAVYFHSPGGNLAAGIQLGRLIRARNFDTAVARWRPTTPTSLSFETIEPAACSSACVMAFIGGRYRFYNSQASLARPVDAPDWSYSGHTRQSLGIHQFSLEIDASMDRPGGFSDGLVASQIVVADLIAYVREMGVDPQLVALASRVPANSLRVLTTQEAYELRVANDPEPPNVWSLTQDGSRLVLQTSGRSSLVPFVAKVACSTQRRGDLVLELDQRIGATLPQAEVDKARLLADWSVVNEAPMMSLAVDRLSIDSPWLRARIRLTDPMLQALRRGSRLSFNLVGIHQYWRLVPIFEMQVPDFEQRAAILRRTC